MCSYLANKRERCGRKSDTTEKIHNGPATTPISSRDWSSLAVRSGTVEAEAGDDDVHPLVGDNSKSWDDLSFKINGSAPFVDLPDDAILPFAQYDRFNSSHSQREHLLRCHTPPAFKNPLVCGRCLEGFKSRDLVVQHLQEEPLCLIKSPEIINGKVTLEQAVNDEEKALRYDGGGHVARVLLDHLPCE